jgi:hypothetical protein
MLTNRVKPREPTACVHFYLANGVSILIAPGFGYFTPDSLQSVIGGRVDTGTYRSEAWWHSFGSSTLPFPHLGSPVVTAHHGRRTTGRTRRPVP